ncbi:hypothetical protein ER308_05175 [Egibacter rhizosphaerae]|uniref:Phosphoribosyltransferase domain-containing protein n=1 Tax=Egibacter rhizosphaerae TaxID=1670831 RepID=A0A411YCU7_9ACTN|nr:phosphoribosyltransferase family protein [Egibacter rhizosphaerae]QBI18995.1 hypothetical protein ER308_05175 [Egibacter rhizosphaerae]
MIFTDRREAGRLLADALRGEPAVRGADRVVVLAVPRGGLPVAVEVARALEAPLDVAVSRSLRAPHDPEVSIGSVGADGHVEIDDAAVARLGLVEENLRAEIDERRDLVARRLALYREVLEPLDPTGAVAVVVDDGVASGGTATQACGLARRAGADTVVLAVPVASATAVPRLEQAADRVVVLTSPAEFLAVGQAYQEFPQVDDEAALAVLEQAPADSARG